MRQYLIQFSYAPDSVRSMVSHPDVNHALQASAMVASLGGKLLGYWYAFGPFDGVVLIEAPDSSVTAAITMAIGGTGEVSRIETTVLLSMKEAKDAMYLAAKAKNLPPRREETK